MGLLLLGLRSGSGLRWGFGLRSGFDIVQYRQQRVLAGGGVGCRST